MALVRVKNTRDGTLSATFLSPSRRTSVNERVVVVVVVVDGFPFGESYDTGGISSSDTKVRQNIPTGSPPCNPEKKSRAIHPSASENLPPPRSMMH